MQKDVRYYEREGNEEYVKGNYTKAIEHYSEAIKLGPQPYQYNRRSAAWHKLGKFDKALEDAVKARTMEPEKNMWHLREAAALFFLKRFDEALRSYLHILGNGGMDPIRNEKLQKWMGAANHGKQLQGAELDGWLKQQRETKEGPAIKPMTIGDFIKQGKNSRKAFFDSSYYQGSGYDAGTEYLLSFTGGSGVRYIERWNGGKNNWPGETREWFGQYTEHGPEGNVSPYGRIDLVLEGGHFVTLKFFPYKPKPGFRGHGGSFLHA